MSATPYATEIAASLVVSVEGNTHFRGRLHGPHKPIRERGNSSLLFRFVVKGRTFLLLIAQIGPSKILTVVAKKYTLLLLIMRKSFQALQS